MRGNGEDELLWRGPLGEELKTYGCMAGLSGSAHVFQVLGWDIETLCRYRDWWVVKMN